MFFEFILSDKEDGALPAFHAGRPDLRHIGAVVPAFLLGRVRYLETDAIEIVAAAVV